MEKLQVSFDGEAINEYLKKAVLDSTIGKVIHEELERKLNDYNFRSSITLAIHQEIQFIINKCVNEFLATKQEIFREAIAKEATDEAVAKLAYKAWENLLDKYGK